MATPSVQHEKLGATFNGTVVDVQGVPVHQFRGIKYASVPARFELPQPVDSFGGKVVDATRYGYVCFA